MTVEIVVENSVSLLAHDVALVWMRLGNLLSFVDAVNHVANVLKTANTLLQVLTLEVAESEFQI